MYNHSRQDKFSELRQPDDDNEANLDDLDDEKFYAALDQVELPPPWEKRRERASDRPGNRMQQRGDSMDSGNKF